VKQGSHPSLRESVWIDCSILIQTLFLPQTRTLIRTRVETELGQELPSKILPTCSVTY